jgi:hypothetical protein
MNISGNSILEGYSTINASLNVSGVTTLQGDTTILSTLNVSGISIFDNSVTMMSSLFVSGRSMFSDNATFNKNAFVLGTTIFNSSNIISLNVSTLNSSKIKGVSICTDTANIDVMDVNNTFISNGDSIFESDSTMNSSLFVGGSIKIGTNGEYLEFPDGSQQTTAYLNNGIFNTPTSINSTLNVSGNSTIWAKTTLLSSLNVSGNTTINGLTKFKERAGFARLNQTEINGLTNTTEADTIFNTDTKNLNIYSEGVWNDVIYLPAYLSYYYNYIATETTLVIEPSNIYTKCIDLTLGSFKIITANTAGFLIPTTGVYQIQLNYYETTGGSETVYYKIAENYNSVVDPAFEFIGTQGQNSILFFGELTQNTTYHLFIKSGSATLNYNNIHLLVKRL